MLTKEYTEVKGNPTQKPDSAAKPNSHLTSGRLLARNTIWNLLGQVLPMAVGLVTIPPIIRGVGVERFGVLSLAWVVVGYFSLFDLGIGRALTKLVADKLSASEEHAIAPLAWMSLWLMFLFGAIGSAVALLISPLLVHRLLKVPAELQVETVRGFYLLAVSIPIVTVAAGLRGILEALQRFGVTNLIRVPMSVFSYAGPLLVLPYSHSLVPIIAVLVLGRVVGCGAHYWACVRAVPQLNRWDFGGSERAAIGRLIRLGGWITVSNIVSPLMVTLDRFVIGSLVSMGAVAYYATPYEFVTKLWLLPGALMGVMFPAFSASFTQDPNRTTVLLGRSVKSVFLVLFPITLCIIVFAQDGLRLWLGTEFAKNSFRVMQWLAAGVFINSLAHAPFALLQGVGRPDLTAKLHLAELPVYVVFLWYVIIAWGIEGAAIAWTARVAVDALFLFAFAGRIVPRIGPIKLRTMLCAAGTILMLVIAALLRGLVTKALFLLGTISGFTLVAWFLVLTPEERALAKLLKRKSDVVGATNLIGATHSR